MSTTGHTVTPAGENRGESHPVIGAYHPEHQFVGSLMWLTADQAQPLLNRVPATAIWEPRSRWAYELIRGLVDAGTDPTPVCVLAAGRHQAARDALDADGPPSATQHKHLALYLFDTYAQAIAPDTAIDTYAQEILDAAYRRAFDTCGLRMQQLAACPGATRDDLAEQFAAIRDQLTNLRRRAQPLGTPSMAAKSAGMQTPKTA
jgi:hypothetical protein